LLAALEKDEAHLSSYRSKGRRHGAKSRFPHPGEPLSRRWRCLWSWRADRCFGEKQMRFANYPHRWCPVRVGSLRISEATVNLAGLECADTCR
jgi:hypothetical protein